jgi:hypothetical protein
MSCDFFVAQQSSVYVILQGGKHCDEVLSRDPNGSPRPLPGRRRLRRSARVPVDVHPAAGGTDARDDPERCPMLDICSLRRVFRIRGVALRTANEPKNDDIRRSTSCLVIR